MEKTKVEEFVGHLEGCCKDAIKGPHLNYLRANLDQFKTWVEEVSEMEEEAAEEEGEAKPRDRDYISSGNACHAFLIHNYPPGSIVQRRLIVEDWRKTKPESPEGFTSSLSTFVHLGALEKRGRGVYVWPLDFLERVAKLDRVHKLKTA